MTVYGRLMAGETLRVQFVGQPDREQFTLGPLWLIGDFYVTKRSDWKQFASIGGVTINKRRKHRMSPGEMQEWCSTVEVIDEKEN